WWWVPIPYFFSSRRRHTRLQGDWSSDVCSSDLTNSQLANTEIFGPVLSLIHANSIDEAMEFLRRSPYGNQASLFTTSGSAARKFRYEAPAGNIGINIGVAAPMAYFPFSGWKESFFGILHGQGRDAVEFFTESKIVIERWSRQETRKF